MGESLIENSGEGCYLGLGEECWRHDQLFLACPIIHVIAPELNRVHGLVRFDIGAGERTTALALSIA